MQSVAVGDDRYGMYFYINEAVGVSGIDPPVILTDATLSFKEGKIRHLSSASNICQLPPALARDY